MRTKLMRTKHGRFSGIILTLAMVVALLSIGSMTAYADSGTATVSTLEELQSALENSSVNTVILSNTLTLPNGTTLDGQGKTVQVKVPYLTETGTVNNDYSQYNLFSIECGSTVTIKNMIIYGGSKGSENYAAGGICNYGTLYLSDSTITRSCRGLYTRGISVLKNTNIVRNACGYGGGILCSGGKLVMDGCSLSDNRSTVSGGGAMEINNNGTLYANNIVIANNSSSEIGGAINNYNSNVYIMNSTIVGNTTTRSAAYGGGFGLNGGKLCAVNCILKDNQSISGGTGQTASADIGIYSSSQNDKLINCIYGTIQKRDSSYNINTESCYEINDYSTYLNYSNYGVLYGTGNITNGYNHPALISKSGTTNALYANPTTTGSASSGGVATYFDYSDLDNIKMLYGAGEDKTNLITGQSGKIDESYKVSTYYEGGERADGVIGACSTCDKRVYTVKLEKAPTNGTVSGITLYGDGYWEGTNATISATPADGYYFIEWQKADGEAFSSLATTTFSVSENISLYPVFSTTRPIASIDCQKEETSENIGSTIQYRVGDSSEWISGTGEKIALNPGTVYYFRSVGNPSKVEKVVLPARSQAPDIEIDYYAETANTTADQEYSIDGGEWTDCTADMSASDWAGKTVKIRVKATDSCYKSNEKEVFVPERSQAPDIKIDYDAETVNTSDTQEYSIYDGETWTDWTDCTADMSASDWAGKTVKIRVKATDSCYKSNEKEVFVPERSQAPDIEIDYYAETANTTADQEYSIDGGEWTDCTADMSASDWAGKTVKIRVKATDSCYKSNEKEVFVPERSQAPDIEIDYYAETANTTADQEYSIDGGEWTDCTADMSASDWAGKTVKIRVKATDSSYKSEEQTIEIAARPAATTLTATEETGENKQDAKLSGVTTDMEYKIGSGEWTAGTGADIANPDNETIQVRMKATDTTFAGEIQTITFREGKTNTGIFGDVTPGLYFYNAVYWALNKGITSGIDLLHFSPDTSCTRAQMVTFLWRAAGSPDLIIIKNPFEDVSSDDYYYTAVLWAVQRGIVKGTSAATFSPNDVVKRCQAVTFLARMNGVKDSDTGYSHSFFDVSKSEYYSNAVAWAASKGITSGTTATLFSPNADCLRCQIVTFLYRCFK